MVEAIRDFQIDLERRNLSTETLRKYRRLLGDIGEFASATGIRRLEHFEVADVRRFVASWKFGPITAPKQLERLRSFFGFCSDSKWIDENPTI